MRSNYIVLALHQKKGNPRRKRGREGEGEEKGGEGGQITRRSRRRIEPKLKKRRTRTLGEMSRSGVSDKFACAHASALRLVARSYFAVLVALFLRSISSPYCSPSILSLASFALSLVLRLLGPLLSVPYCSLSFALSLLVTLVVDYPCDIEDDTRDRATAGKLTRNIVHCARVTCF